MAAVAGMDTALAAWPFHQGMFITNVLQNYAKKYAIVNSAPRFFSNYDMAVSLPSLWRARSLMMSAIFSLAQSMRLLTTGRNDMLRSVRLYSTLGGTSA